MPERPEMWSAERAPETRRGPQLLLPAQTLARAEPGAAAAHPVRAAKLTSMKRRELECTTLNEIIIMFPSAPIPRLFYKCIPE